VSRVLYVSQYFVTGDQPGGVRHWRHARALRDAGHEVSVVTSYVQHKERTVPEAYRGRRIVRETEDGLDVWRTYATPGYGRDLASRLANYLSFAVLATVAGMRVPRPDVVVASSPSLPAAAGAALVALVRRARFVLEVRDLWPESAVAMGLVRERSAMALAARALAWFCYRRADRVIALTEGIRDGVAAKGVDPRRIVLITNGIDLDGPPPPPVEVPVPEDAFVAMYVGAHGTYSSLDTVLQAAEALRDDKGIRFVLVGGGDRKPALVAEARRRGLANVAFVDPVPKRDVPGWLARASVCLLPYQDRPLFAGALPNKTFDYMGAGRPIVAAVPPGELSRLVEAAGCGLAVPPEDPRAMADAVLRLFQDGALAARLGAAGAGFVRTHYDRRVLAERFVGMIEGLLGARPGGRWRVKGRHRRR
jgi:colanic acid biosynthesis glycosyl transferase WcaI